MAKLNGVSTIDMVNGEITKIAYDGAEYAKVDEHAKAGDILLRVSKGIATQVTVGSFYKCPKESSEDKTWYTDEEGDNMTSASYNFVVFRKITADKPALDARVDALEERVTALEGGEQADAKTAVGATIKVVKSNFDRVFGEIDGAGYGKDGQGLVKIGATGEIVDVNSKGIFAKFTEADMISGRYNRERFYLENGEYEVIAPAKPQYKTVKHHAKVGERILITLASPLYPQSYADGDIMTVTKADVISKGDVYVEGQTGLIDYREYEVIVEANTDKPAAEITHNGATYELVTRKAQPGDVVYVTKEAESTDAIPNDAQYLVDKHGKIEGWDVYPTYADRTEANVLVYAPKELPKPKTGDIVVITANTNGSRNKVGDIGKVGSDGGGYTIDVHVPGKTEGNGNYTKYNEMRLATPAEVAEYEKSVAEAKTTAVFTKIGRKPGEFKKGDIVRVIKVEGGISNGHPHGVIGVVEYDASPVDIGCGNPSVLYDGKSLLCNCELIAPVESRVDAK